MYDVIVVGAGIAGCTAASLLAKKGFKVCLIDAKRAEDVGEKVCGDALISRGLDSLGFKPPMHVITNVASALNFHAPGIESIKLKTRIFLLDRLRFGQYFLHKAIDNGSIFLDKCRAFAPILKDDKVIGIKAKIGNSEVEFYAKVVIDASGINGAIRRNLPKDWWVSKPIKGYNLALCYREIRKLKRLNVDRDYCDVFYDRKVVPSGYYWVFPKKDDLVNVGLGARMATINYDLRERFYKHVIINPIFDESEILANGFGIVPINPPLGCFTASGFIVIGDAAGQVNSFIGEGIRPSIISAIMAAEAIAEAESFEQDRLWSYNIDFMKKIGIKHASFAAFSSFFGRLDHEEVKSLLSVFEGGTYNFGDFEDFNISLLLTLKASLKGFKKLKSILKEASIVKSVRSIYRDYPDSPKKFLEWRDRVKRFWKGYH
ncbi:MAG: geranylgeranyl reductase family protein [archaeon]|nr:geranylgeranyl reductase family protein [archaeon]